MKALKSLLLLLPALIIACEKADIPDDSKQTGSGDSGNNEWQETWDIDSTEYQCLTVAEAIEADLGTVITVRGYVVGSTSRTMRNAKYLPPFEGKSAIILSDFKLADSPGFYEDELLPVRINDYKQYQDRLNLVDNPQYFERQVTITGFKDTYLGQPGISVILWCDLLE